MKHTAADFLVREDICVPLREPESDTEGRFTYLQLRKCGLTTFEAIAKVASHFNLRNDRVLYAGLKDEDGITEQLVALDQVVPAEAVAKFNDMHQRNADAFITLRLHGVGDEPLRIGGLTGNSFRIRVRNLSPEAAHRLAAAERYTFYFFNYYDRQRFGVPNAPKTTHLIGHALLEGNYAVAMSLLREARTPESQKALNYVGPPEEFFASIDDRITNFYKSSHSSYVWNQRLREEINGHRLPDTYEDSEDGIEFLFSRRQAEVVRLLAQRPMIEYTKHYGGDRSSAAVGLRSTAVQVQIHCSGAGRDDAHSSRHWCDLSFFLPSGSYATMCVRQLVNVMELPIMLRPTIDSAAAAVL
jgi:tRNA pseudouridine13 synthase